MALIKSTQNLHWQVFSLALPIMISNVSVPLLGAVDTAVIGHLPEAKFLASVALATTLLGALYAGLNFLRMGTAGLTAASFGRKDHSEMLGWLYRGLLTALVLGILLWMIQKPLSTLAFSIMSDDANLTALSAEYFSIRILSAPAALMHFTLLGWLIGIQKTRVALTIQLVMNLCNIILDIVFVVYLDYGIKGAASATVIAESASILLGFYLTRTIIRDWHLKRDGSRLFTMAIIKRLFGINRDLFLRSMGLQGSFLAFATVGAQQGETILAANAVLLNFLLFCAYGLDGIANAAESLVGQAYGEGNRDRVRQAIWVTLLWSVILALPFTLIYGIFGQDIIQLLTNMEAVRQVAYDYLPWAVALPLLSVWCYHFDGCFTGATQTGAMRNSMVVSFILFLGCIFLLLPHFQNHGLWAAFVAFHIFRALTLGIGIKKLYHQLD